MNKRKFPLWAKITLSLILIISIIGISGWSYFLSYYNKVNKVEIDKSDLGIASKDEMKEYSKANDIINIALFGIDSTDGGTGRSDSIMIATIDPVHNKLKITSVMRDSYVNIPDRGMDKINHAYAFGGPQLAIKTLNQNFGLNIDKFVSVNFSSLPKIIDSLGGIDLNIRPDELDYINSYINDLNRKDGTNSPLISSTGTQHVNGIQALAYSRIRYTSGGDYERTERHRTVLTGLFNKLKTTPVSEYSSVVSQLLPFVETNIAATEIVSLGTKLISIGNGDLIQDRFPRDGYCQGETINGVYYLTFDLETAKSQMRDYIFNDK